MKENLFRGKREDNGRWIEGYLLEQNTPEYHCYIVISFKAEQDARHTDILECDIYEVIPETVSLCIGRNDRKNNPIFGGDIFFIYGEYDNGLYTEDRSGYAYVDYNNEWCQWELRNFSGEWLDSFYNYMEEPFEDEREGCVCGNIHDNPELLKDGAEK